MTHEPGCPCNDADERGCFLISAMTDKCISCTCNKVDSSEAKVIEHINLPEEPA